MDNIISFIENSKSELILGLFILCIILLILLFFTMINLSLFKSKYGRLNKGSKGFSFDEHILNNKKEIEFIKHSQTDILKKLDSLDMYFQKAYTKMNLFKYNAFENQGGQLSFILVMLDENRDGFILHNIHNQDFSYLYGKNVTRGTTKETLTDDEKRILLETIKK